MYEPEDIRVGIIIDKYPSVAEVIKILRKYTDDSMMDIRNHMSNNEFVYSCPFVRDDEVRKLIKIINDLKKNKITVKIYERDEEITLQLLKNRVQSSREDTIRIEAETELEVAENDPADLEPFSYLWETEQDDYVVLKDEYDYTIFNVKTKQALLIEDEDLNNQVAAMMIMAGNRVVDGKRAINKLFEE